MKTHSAKFATVAITMKVAHSLMAAAILLSNYAFAQDTVLTSNTLAQAQVWSSNLSTPNDLDQLRDALTTSTVGSSPQALRITPTVAKQAFESNSSVWEAILEGQPTNIPLTEILRSQPLPNWRATDGLDLYVTYDDKDKLDMIVVRPPSTDPSRFTIDFATDVFNQGKTFKQFTTDYSTPFQELLVRQQSSDRRIANVGQDNPLIDGTQHTINLDMLRKKLDGIHESGDLLSATNVVIGAPDVMRLLSEQKEALIAINRKQPMTIDLSKLTDADELPPEFFVEGLDAYALYDKHGQFRELVFRPWDLDEAKFLNFLPLDWDPVPAIVTWSKQVISTIKQTINVARNSAKGWACGLEPAPTQITITVEASFAAGPLGLGAGATYEYEDLCG